ncbi:hypothetical protein [Streptomyces scopuliridis]|uniref:DUF559 domain-containing protein n=1 Tax=Streptomyces scopuliridis RB72 TaxID=1440053 RepID=A0A2T7TFS6_9ACTN|nr:hypothetical protein [Streptomyces scopuliridis]PVE13992.1 hypothetical protein Y717_32830 [Streptomyces scopuliridis RB72]
MNNNTPVSPHRLSHLGHLSDDVRSRVLSLAQLRERGVPGGRATAQCRPGGPWQQPLPGVFLLHAGPPTAEERLQAVLLYAGRPSAESSRGVPAQPGRLAASATSASSASSTSTSPTSVSPYGAVMITGLAALSLYGFSSAPPLLSLDHVDVLVPRTRRLRSTGYARLIRAHSLPRPERIDGMPVAPVGRALADAVAESSDADAVVTLLTEAVRAGHCEPALVVRELSQSGLLARQHVVDAVDSLLAEGRTLAEGRLYELVRVYGLQEPLWNVDLRLPGGPHLGGVDAYWPDQAVAVELDTRAPRPGGRDAERTDDEDEQWAAAVRKREHLERLGITVVHLTPRKLREALDQQATVVRTALMAANDRDPAAQVVILPR